jgi:ribosomal protein S21
MSAHRNTDKSSFKKGLKVDVRVGRDADEAMRNLEHALKTLKRRVMQEGLIKDLRKNEYYETKGQKARRRHKEAIRRSAKANRLRLERDMV